MKTTVLTLCLLALAAGAVAEQAGPRLFRVYPLQVDDALPLIEVIRELVGRDLKIVHDKPGSRLLVMASPDQHREIAVILKDLNVPPRNVRLEVVFSEVGHSVDSGAGVALAGGVVATPDGVSGSVTVKPGVHHRDNSLRMTSRQSLLVRSGGEAQLAVGTAVPYAEWLFEYGYRHGYIAQTVRFERVGAYLRVRPIVLGDGESVALRLTPELSGMVEGKLREIRYANVATDVTLRDGDTVSIGGLDSDEEFYSRFLVGGKRSEATRRLNIQVTAHIVPH